MTRHPKLGAVERRTALSVNFLTSVGGRHVRRGNEFGCRTLGFWFFKGAGLESTSLLRLATSFDQLNRLAQKSYPDTSTVNYTYDNDSRLTQVTDPTGTYQFTFDNMGRLSGTSTQYGF